MTHPLALKRVIGFVVPAWNASRWIKETLKSLLAQTSDCWRAIVVNDGSTDDTGDQVDRFRRTHRLADDRIWLTRVQHGGLAKAVNAGIRQLGGHVDCLACVGADDHVSEHYVERLLAPFTNPAVLATFPRVIEFGMRIKEWHPGPYKPGVLAEKNIIPGCAVWRTKVWHKLQGFDERFVAGMEDWHFAARAEAQAVIGPYNGPVFVPEAVYYHRARIDSLTDSMTSEYRAWATRTIRELFPQPALTEFHHIPLAKSAALVRGPFDLDQESA